MAKKFFPYTREEQKVKLDENGKGVPLTETKKDEAGVETKENIPGKFETEIVIRQDILDIQRVIRCHMIAEDHAVVLLHDGHETTEVKPILKNKNKRPPYNTNDFAEEKQRIWVQSEIHIKGKSEVERLYDVLLDYEV